MELFPIITKVLLTFCGIFMIVLIISFLISRFREEKKEIITESYPAQGYQFYSGRENYIPMQNRIGQYYFAGNNPSDGNFFVKSINEDLEKNYENEFEDNQTNQDNYSNPFIKNRNNYEEDVYENPMRKTSSFNLNYSSESNDTKNVRMQVINEEPLFKFGWE